MRKLIIPELGPLPSLTSHKKLSLHELKSSKAVTLGFDLEMRNAQISSTLTQVANKTLKIIRTERLAFKVVFTIFVHSYQPSNIKEYSTTLYNTHQ
jgi:hypothetical protein